MQGFKIFDLTMSIVALILAAILTFMAIFMMGWIIGIDKMESLEDFMISFSNVMLSTLLVFGVIFIIFFILIIIYWIFGVEDAVILPFEVSKGLTNYSGKAISDLLAVELQRVTNIHDSEYGGVKPIESEKLSLPILNPKSETLSDDISKLGTIGLGSSLISIGSLLMTIKRLCPGSSSTKIIVGSMQKYGSIVCLVARFENQDIRLWQVGRDIRGRKKTLDKQIPYLVRELSFKIAYDLSPSITSNTIDEFKYFSEALSCYRTYLSTGDDKSLECAKENCIKAMNYKNKYEKLFGLLYNLGLIYINKNNYFISVELFRKATELIEDADAYHGLGYSLSELKKDEEAIKYYDKAINLNGDLAGAWNNKGISLQKIKSYDEADMCFNKAICLKYLSFAYSYRKSGYESKLTDMCKEIPMLIDGKDEYNLARFEAICNGDAKKAVDHITAALNKNQQTPDFICQDRYFDFIREDIIFKNFINNLPNLTESVICRHGKNKSTIEESLC